METFRETGLNPEIIKAITEIGFEKPTPVQEKTIPCLLEDKTDLFWENKGRLRAPIGMDLTPPGYKPGTGPQRLVNPLGICKFDENGEMYVAALHAGISESQAKESFGWPVRVQDGFVAARESGKWRIEAMTGSPQITERILDTLNLPMLTAAGQEGNGLVISVEGNWIFPLRAQAGDMVIGIFGMPAPRASSVVGNPVPDLDDREHDLAEALVRQAELALEDRQLQQNVFRALQPLNSEIELLQRARSKPRYAGAIAREGIEEELVPSADFHRAVKDALDHFWGGPKLTDSPLLELEIVRASLPMYDFNAVRALRGVLAEAIESLKPDGERSLTAPEWMLYNILELKILQGMKIRDIALRLAMSESDIYRKQRFAIQEVARTMQQKEEMQRVQKPTGEATRA